MARILPMLSTLFCVFESPHFSKNHLPTKRRMEGRFGNRTLILSVGILLTVFAVAAHAAGTMQWTAKFVDYDGTQSAQTYTNNIVYSSKAQAIAAMKALDPYGTQGQLLTKEVLFSIDGDATVTSKFTAPVMPVIYSDWFYYWSLPTTYASEGDAAAAPLDPIGHDVSCSTVTKTPTGAWFDTDFVPMPDDDSEQRPYQEVLTATGNCGAGTTTYNLPMSKYLNRSCATAYYSIRTENFPLTCVVYAKAGYVTGKMVECPSNGSAVPSVGDPCDVSLGDFSQTEPDYASAGLNFTRSYHSVSLDSSHALGVGWTHSYAGSLLVANNIPTGLATADGHHDALLASTTTTGMYISLSGAGIHVQQISGNWVAYRGDGSNDVYSAAGQLIQKVTATGQVTTLTYNTSGTATGLLASVIGPFGHNIQLAYDSNNRLIKLTEPDGTSAISYSYDSNNNLTSVTYPVTSGLAQKRIYKYEQTGFPNNLTSIWDEANKQFVTIGYDTTTGAVTSSQQAGGVQAVSITYGVSTAAVVDSLNSTTTYTFTNDGHPDRVTNVTQGPLSQSFAVQSGYIDVERRVSQTTDRNGNITQFSYDEDHLKSKTEAYGTSLQRVTTYGNFLATNTSLPQIITEPLRTTAYTYYAGTTQLNTKKITDTSVTPNASRTWTYTYDSNNNLYTVVGPRANGFIDKTIYTYYVCTTGAKCGQLYQMTDNAGHTTTYNVYNAHGQPTTITDPNNVLTTLLYDERQQLKSVQVTKGSGFSETTLYDHDVRGLLQKVTLPDASFIQYGYDDAHRLTDVTDGLGNHTHYALDSMGNVTGEQTYDPTPTLRRQHSRVINSLNQLYQDINAAGTAAATTTYTYDNNGNKKTIAAPMARNTANYYDSLNRLNQITDPANGNTYPTYDSNNSLATLKDPRGLITTYNYNAFNQIAKLISPDTGTTTYHYNTGGSVDSVTDARGVSASYQHDNGNRGNECRVRRSDNYLQLRLHC